MNLRFLEYRVQQADMIIFLDMPRFVCFWRIFKRLMKYYGKETPSSAAQCPEGIRKEFFVFLKWVWNFKKNYVPKVMKLLNAYADAKEIYIFTSSKEIEQLLEKINKIN